MVRCCPLCLTNWKSGMWKKNNQVFKTCIGWVNIVSDQMWYVPIKGMCGTKLEIFTRIFFSFKHKIYCATGAANNRMQAFWIDYTGCQSRNNHTFMVQLSSGCLGNCMVIMHLIGRILKWQSLWAKDLTHSVTQIEAVLSLSLKCERWYVLSFMPKLLSAQSLITITKTIVNARLQMQC